MAARNCLRYFRRSKNWTTSNLHAGRFTAACGVYIYRGGLLHFQYNGNAFTCDPTGNLVHAERMTPKGATFSAKPLFKEKEFLASPDDWFRPVFLNDGPDGALYVVDMYRAVIEHPQFMPAELKNRPDLLLGKDKGRIWRIVPKKHQSSAIRVNLGKEKTPALVSYLFNSKNWYRTTAQRLLLQREDRAAIPPLKDACLSRKEAQGRVLAAWLLERFGTLDEPLLLKLLKDSQPRLREQAVLLAEKRLKDSQPVREQVLRMATDPDAKVRFQVALSLGEWNDVKILPPLVKIALAGAEDTWTRQAVYSSASGRAGALIHYLLEPSLKFTKPNTKTPGREALFQELSQLVGARADQAEVRKLLTDFLQIQEKSKVSWQLLGLHGLAQGLGQRGKQLSTVVASFPKEYKALADKTNSLLAVTAKIARTEEINLPARLTAISLLAHVPWDTAKPALVDLLENDPLKEIRMAAVRSLAAHSEPEVATLLLKSWKGYTPALRGAATEALLRNSTWTQALLAEVEAGRIKPGDFNSLTINRLLKHKQPQISAKAQKLLKGNLPEARLQVIAKYQAALKMKGDAARGQKVFEKNCATCHKVGKTGVDVGPDISDSRTKTPEAYLADILNPNQAIDNNYVNYVVLTKTGRVITGIIMTETASSLTLRRAAKETDTVLRQDIDEITSSGVSLMPEGLEKDIPVSEMADLLSFLKNWRYLDGEIPIGQGG